MNFNRTAGILLHPTSLPSKYGIGELGSEIYNFINFLSESRQSLWQVFPLGPTGYGDSPYQCFSAFAGNPLLISVENLIEEELLSESEIGDVPQHDPHKIDYGQVINYKNDLLKKAFENYRAKNESNGDYEAFCESNKEWLDDYALFMSCKNYHGGIVWKDWDEEIAFRKPGAVEKWNEKLADDIFYQKFLQYKFYTQWIKVKEYANSKGIQIIGDLPIFIAYDSSDLWANKELFTVNEDGKLETVAGVPPDYFSKTGQLWGNPLYIWDEMAKDNYLWWQKRFSKMYEFIDIVRIDHFRGFEAYYEIPGDAETAINGTWRKAPGYELFNTLKKELGDVPIIAEDLGLITKEVRELRDHFNFPGMKILQFAFGENGDKLFLPHNHVQNCVVYTGSHDNDTTRAFFEKEKANGSGVYEWAEKYLNYYGNDMRYEIIRTAYASVADIVVVPMQDWLNLGADARMNFPGTLGGNWTWRFTWDQVHNGLAENIKELTVVFERPKEKDEEEIEIKAE